MNLNLNSKLINSVGQLVHGQVPPKFMVRGVSVDAETVEEGSLYIPMMEQGTTAEQRLEVAIEQGAMASLWESGVPLPRNLPADFPIFEVTNLLEAMKKMAKLHLEEVDPTIIAITGLQDVETTKNFVTRILQSKFKVQSYLQQNKVRDVEIDLCQSVLQMNGDTEVFVCELSIHHKEGIGELSSIIEPNLAMITPYPDSTESTYSREDYVLASAKVEEGMKATALLVIDGDDPVFNREWKTDAIKCGESDNCIFQLKSFSEKEQEVEFELMGIHMIFTLLNSSPEAIKSAIFAIAISVHLGMIAEDIHEALKSR